MYTANKYCYCAYTRSNRAGSVIHILHSIDGCSLETQGVGFTPWQSSQSIWYPFGESPQCWWRRHWCFDSKTKLTFVAMSFLANSSWHFYSVCYDSIPTASRCIFTIRQYILIHELIIFPSVLPFLCPFCLIYKPKSNVSRTSADSNTFSHTECDACFELKTFFW